jgi:hypothetical protein
MSEEVVVGGDVFDSFSESNSRDGSMHAGSNSKASPLQAARLQACLEEVLADRGCSTPEAGVSCVLL